MSKISAYNLARSFVCAFSGIVHSLRYERNMRIHLFAAAYVLYFSRYYEFSRAEFAIILLMIGLVIACELINTAVEATVDLETPVYSALAKIAKDAAAGAVLASAVASVAVGVTLFWNPTVMALIAQDIAADPIIWIFLIAITIFLIAWPEKVQMTKGTNKSKNFELKKDYEDI